MTRRTSFQYCLAGAALLFASIAAPALSAPDQAAPVLTGKWHFTLSTDGGPREFDAEFLVTDGKVGGKFGKNDVKGTSQADKFNLEFPADSEEAGSGTLKLDGKITDDQLSGNWSFQTYDGTFKAARVKPAA